MTKLAFIGAGNMNGAIIKGLIEQGYAAEHIMVTNPSPEKRQLLANSYGVRESADNYHAANFADVIVLGVKPHFLSEVCQHLAATTELDNKCFISIAAGIPVAQIQDALGGPLPIIRAMPNTPAQLGLGMTGLYPSREVSQQQRLIADQLMSAVGKVIWLEQEQQIDAVTAISGSGPAYFFLFMEAMAAQAQVMGFTEQQSRQLVSQTALGAASMVCQDITDIAELRARVTSKGGTTQAAINQFQTDNLQQLVTKAMTAALHRAQEMAQNNQASKN